MSKMLERCKACVDQTFIEWEKCTKMQKEERRSTEEHIVWGIVHMALYILDFKEYNELKRYIYNKYGYDAGGAADGQMDLFDMTGNE